ncbi:MAG: hypothetical protein F6J97_22135 [Leptolyngbya sp. SIO4C1]|nr:hypothetical protein [Leptolyngbya sp. SIO4C1]
MGMQRLEIQLPESVYRQLARIAEETAQSIEALAAQSVMSNLPPSADDASPELRAELLRMQVLETEDLLRIAQAKTESVHHERQAELLEKNEDGLLTQAERQELAQLRQVCDQLMLRKAYAWSVLRWRGQRVPKLQELSIPQ